MPGHPEGACRRSIRPRPGREFSTHPGGVDSARNAEAKPAELLVSKELRKIAKLSGIQIRYGAKFKTILLPREKVIALNCLHPDRRASAIFRGPHIQINDVKRAAINEHGNFAVF